MNLFEKDYFFKINIKSLNYISIIIIRFTFNNIKLYLINI